jgi:hypothetical protein
MCQTLPPVLVNYELDETSLDRTRRVRSNIQKQMTIRPQMPIPELLHLAFTARTLVYNEYVDLCSDTSQLEKFFIDTCLGNILFKKKYSTLTKNRKYLRARLIHYNKKENMFTECVFFHFQLLLAVIQFRHLL